MYLQESIHNRVRMYVSTVKLTLIRPDDRIQTQQTRWTVLSTADD